jgi:hypothetical protein
MDGRTDKQADRQPDDRHTDSQTTDRQTKPLNSSRFLEILRTNYREQISRLEIRELNLIFPVPVPEDGNGKIKKPTMYLSNPNQTSLHLTRPHLTSPHLTSPHLTSPHLTSPHLNSTHLT